MSKKKKLIWQLYPSYLIITLLAVAAMLWSATEALRTSYLKHTIDQLRSDALLVMELASGLILSRDYQGMDKLCKKLGREISTRITVILPSGQVVGDSVDDPERMDDHSARPEIKEALKGNMGVSERYSSNRSDTMVYLALALQDHGNIIGIVRTSKLVPEINKALYAMYFRVGIEGLIIAVFAAVVSYLVSRRVNRPISELKDGAVRFSSGDLEHRLRVTQPEELVSLAEAMNRMAADLQDLLVQNTRQRNELEGILSGMVEAVLVVDPQEHLIKINAAASRLFEVNGETIEGRSIIEAIRNRTLQEFVKLTLSSKSPVETEILVMGQPDKFWQAHGTTLPDGRGMVTNALIVLNDVTRLKKLEHIRRDFVANVSHELKTPVTLIKGFLETLQDGALSDAEAANRFVDIALRHTDRLNLIIEDLLTLSRLEQDEGKEGVLLETKPLNDILQIVMDSFDEKAKEKIVTMKISCEDELKARVNANLIIQALSNLVDNSLRNSNPGGKIILKAEAVGGEVVISVEDDGRGIPKPQLERIFERFFRVEKARSGKDGGTGLGLAITKHIVLVHGGRINVESSPGKGSTFTIRLPALESVT